MNDGLILTADNARKHITGLTKALAISYGGGTDRRICELRAFLSEEEKRETAPKAAKIATPKPVQPSAKSPAPTPKKTIMKDEGIISGEEALTALFPNEKSRPHVRKLHRMADAGELPTYRNGLQRFYMQSEVRRAFTRKAGDLTDDELARMTEGALYSEIARVHDALGSLPAQKFRERVTNRRKFISKHSTEKLTAMSEDNLWVEYSRIKDSQSDEASRDFYLRHLEEKA